MLISFLAVVKRMRSHRIQNGEKHLNEIQNYMQSGLLYPSFIESQLAAWCLRRALGTNHIAFLTLQLFLESVYWICSH